MKYEEEYVGKKVVVTGGAGLIGNNLVRRLLELDVEKVIVLDNLSASVKWNLPDDSKLVFVQGSVVDEGMLKRVFVERPEYVFHLAAHFANQKAVDHPDENLEVNGLGTLKMLQWSNLMNVKRFVFASAGCSAYGSRAPVPLKEDFVTLNLDTPYQIHKLLGELYCNYFLDFYGLPTVRLRLFNVFGQGGLPGKYKNVIPNFMFWAIQGQPLPVMGSGNETRDFTFIADIVDGLLRGGIAPEAVGEAINLGSGTETKAIDLANMINKVTGNQSGVKSVGKRDWDKSSRRMASIEKAKKLLGYNPQTSIEDGLKKTHEWFLENMERIEDSALF
ncbi:NAD-dependent epimerase/dehydratase family protein [candidate division WOR-3 bacterium]|nr:NAD-dependent epimerase/dehydratase family protein [candidate division WOR-3 bacterium]